MDVYTHMVFLGFLGVVETIVIRPEVVTLSPDVVDGGAPLPGPVVSVPVYAGPLAVNGMDEAPDLQLPP